MRRRTNKKFISIHEAKRNDKINNLSYVPIRSIINMVTGATMVIVGIVTLPVPCGSLAIIGFGSLVLLSNLPINILLKNSYKDIKIYVENKLIRWGIL